MSLSHDNDELLALLYTCVDDLNDLLYKILKRGYQISINTTIVDVDSPRAYRYPIIKIDAENSTVAKS